MKKRIRLSESQLRRVIREAIKEEYNGGLDWKTLANAMKKRHNQWEKLGPGSGFYDKFERLRRAASDKFNNIVGAGAKRGEDGKIIKGKWDLDILGDELQGSVPISYDVTGDEKFDNYCNNNTKYYENPDAEQALRRHINGETQFIPGKGWNESVVRNITENVMRKLKRNLTEWRAVNDDLIEFDNAEDALKFVKKHINGHEELFINSEGLTFGLGEVYTWDDMARESLESPEAKNANMKQGRNSAFLHFGNEATLLAYLRWLEKKDGSLYFITNPDEEGEPRPLENYI